MLTLKPIVPLPIVLTLFQKSVSSAVFFLKNQWAQTPQGVVGHSGIKGKTDQVKNFLTPSAPGHFSFRLLTPRGSLRAKKQSVTLKKKAVAPWGGGAETK